LQRSTVSRGGGWARQWTVSWTGQCGCCGRLKRLKVAVRYGGGAE
jgi:hypothetical protein